MAPGLAVAAAARAATGALAIVAGAGRSMGPLRRGCRGSESREDGRERHRGLARVRCASRRRLDARGHSRQSAARRPYDECRIASRELAAPKLIVRLSPSSRSTIPSLAISNSHPLYPKSPVETRSEASRPHPPPTNCIRAASTAHRGNWRTASKYGGGCGSWSGMNSGALRLTPRCSSHLTASALHIGGSDRRGQVGVGSFGLHVLMAGANSLRERGEPASARSERRGYDRRIPSPLPLLLDQTGSEARPTGKRCLCPPVTWNEVPGETRGRLM